MGYKSITQIILFIGSLVVIFTYIQPALLTIKDTQDEIFEYTDASNKASELNQKLTQLLEIERSFTRSDLFALEVYLPSDINEMTVMSDITAMAQNSGLRIKALTIGESQSAGEDIVFAGESIKSDGTSYTDFSLKVEGEYESLKEAIKTFEQNKYPLEIVLLSFGGFTSEESGVTTSVDVTEGIYDVVLRTYSYSDISN